MGDFTFASGTVIPNLVLAYESYGKLSATKDNVILLNHALTGSHHAHGFCDTLPEAGSFWKTENHAGWWDLMIGPGRPIDTERYFVICPNFLGGCYGSTGPASIAPDGEPWGSRFPMVTTADQAHAHLQILDALGIERFHIIAPSAGGLVGLTASCLYPERIKGLLLIGVSDKPSIEHQLSVFEQILAIELDENYCEGRYALDKPPLRGLALARIICHKLFVNQAGLAKRARKGISDRKGLLTWYLPERNTESYMLHQGSKFALRFDANSYIRIVHMWANFDLATQTGMRNNREALSILAKHQIPVLLFAISSDSCFMPREISAFHRRMKAIGIASEYHCIKSEKGHDSFLLEPELYDSEIRAFLQGK